MDADDTTRARSGAKCEARNMAISHFARRGGLPLPYLGIFHVGKIRVFGALSRLC